MAHQKTAADIKLILSPVDRMLYTYSIPAAEKEFGVVSKEPIFVFGTPVESQSPMQINSLEKALDHLDIQPAGVYYIPPSSINLELFMAACIEKQALSESPNGFMFSKNGTEFRFSTKDCAANKFPLQQIQGITK